MAVLGIRAPLPDRKVLSLSKASWRQTKTATTDVTNKTGPFQQAISTNETSESMKNVLSWFDGWYDGAVSDDI